MLKFFAIAIAFFAITDHAFSQSAKSAQDYLLDGQALLDVGQYEQALIPLYRACQKDTSLADAFAGRGLAYERLGAFGEAAVAYTRACQLKTDFDFCDRIPQLEVQAGSQKKAADTNFSQDRVACFLAIFNPDYAELKKAKKALAEKGYFPDVAAKHSLPGRPERVTCEALGNLEAELAKQLTAAPIGKTTDIFPTTTGFYMLLKLSEGSAQDAAKNPWEPVLAAIRDSLGIKPPPIESDSTVTEGQSRRARRAAQAADSLAKAPDEVSEQENVQEPDAITKRPTRPKRPGRPGGAAFADSADMTPTMNRPPQMAPGDSSSNPAPADSGLAGIDLGQLGRLFDEPRYVPYDVGPAVVRRIEPVVPELGDLPGGDVVLHVLVHESGKVLNVKINNSFDANGTLGFNNAVMNAVRQWYYQPATRETKPITVWITEKFTFPKTEE